MNRRELFGAGAALISGAGVAAPARPVGAVVPWTTYLAQDMRTNGQVLGPRYGPNLIETESTRQRCVKLAASGDYVEFVATAPADAMVVRYSLADHPDGGGISSTLELSRNGRPVRDIAVTSKYAWVYGPYPFVNAPRAGRPRRFYDEVRLAGIAIARGDVVRLRKADDAAPWCVVDLVDLELLAPAAAAPANALSPLDFGAGGQGRTDDTAALRACIAEAARRGLGVFAPPGTYRLTGEIALPSGMALRGAGMWRTTFIGDADLYARPDRRVRFTLAGRNIRLADFAIVGNLTYRDDAEANDGVIGVHAADCTVSGIWVEHTKVGLWFYGCANMVVEGCRFRNTMADGVNLCTHTADCLVENCTARNTGDDAFAIWPAAFDHGHVQTSPPPGRNVIRRCTAELPYLANGGAIYGGADNRIEDCRFSDISAGSGLLISSTFPTADEAWKIDYGFSGVTVARRCRLERCGGFDHDWAWRGAVQICVDKRDISGVSLSGLDIRDSLSDGLSVVGPAAATGPDAHKHPAARTARSTLTRARLDRVDIRGVGLGAPGSHDLLVRADTRGALAITRSAIGDIADQSPDFSILRG
ncbi:MAG TPA: glycosyl hydrolase family 28-related protein [Caulobacteraceae bacterium]|nr:glycosyl hydrolase family 28-related protein [Caulobacteraceae bacterium]